jgi:asparagine synthase (glutamine-hydrolysing)
MSGICGIRHQERPERLSGAIRQMTRALTLHESTSESHTARDGAAIGLAARFSAQKMYQSADVVLACDTELYNEPALRGAADVRDGSTAALLAALYERFGLGFVERLEGAFSLVIWDARQRHLAAAIDGFGIKRLVYAQAGTSVLVASRVDAIVQTGMVDREVNPRAIANILNFSSNLGPDTVFESVKRIGPGTMLVASASGVSSSKFWDMRYYSGGRANERDLSAQLERVFQDSVATHCKGEPGEELGAFLSGGTDSSTVVGMMARAQNGPVNAFSIGFADQQFNELGYAEIAAKRFGAKHHTYFVTPRDCFEAIEPMVRYFDEPFANSSAIPTYFCARLAAEAGVKALLAGDGGDELFGGNERYRTDKLFELYHSIPGILRRGVIEPALSMAPASGGLIRKARGYVRRANLRGVERFLSFQFLSMHPPAEVFDSGFVAGLGGYSIADTPARYYAEAPARDHLDRLLYVDMKITLADNDLPKVTCMAELAGIHVRFPFLHRPVAEFSGTIPGKLKVKGLEKRYLFKQAFRNLLPIEIIQKQKHGFGIPVAPWMKSDRRLRELLHDTLRSQRAMERGYFRREFLNDLFDRYAADDSTYYGDSLWGFLVLELWMRRVMDNAAVGASV